MSNNYSDDGIDLYRVPCEFEPDDFFRVYYNPGEGGDPDEVWCEIKDGSSRRQCLFGSVEDAAAKLSNAHLALLDLQADAKHIGPSGAVPNGGWKIGANGNPTFYEPADLTCWYTYSPEEDKWLWMIGEEFGGSFSVIRFAKADSFTSAIWQQKKHLEQLTGIVYQ